MSSVIPVFFSCPTHLNDEQEKVRMVIEELVKELGLIPRSLGRSDYYGIERPLREVHAIARHCAGGIIFGFKQFISETGVSKPGTKEEKKHNSAIAFPTPWNNLEAGIIFSLGLPMVVLREEGVRGGVFDDGSIDAMIHDIPPNGEIYDRHDYFRQVIARWYGKVSEGYYEFRPQKS